MTRELTRKEQALNAMPERERRARLAALRALTNEVRHRRSILQTNLAEIQHRFAGIAPHCYDALADLQVLWAGAMSQLYWDYPSIYQTKEPSDESH